MTTKTDVTEDMAHKGVTNVTPVYTPVDQGCSECAELRKLVEVAGRMASMVRHIVGGVDFTTGYKKQSVNVTNLGVAIDELRRLVDEYDKVILECPKKGS